MYSPVGRRHLTEITKPGDLKGLASLWDLFQAAAALEGTVRDGLFLIGGGQFFLFLLHGFLARFNGGA